MRPALIRGVVLLPEPSDLAGAVLTVRLRDTLMADGPAPLIGSVRRRVSQRHAHRLSFVLPLSREIPEDSRPALEAELRTQPGRGLRRGDWLTVRHVPWPAAPGHPVVVPVAQL